MSKQIFSLSQKIKKISGDGVWLLIFAQIVSLLACSSQLQPVPSPPAPLPSHPHKKIERLFVFPISIAAESTFNREDLQILSNVIRSISSNLDKTKYYLMSESVFYDMVPPDQINCVDNFSCEVEVARSMNVHWFVKSKAMTLKSQNRHSLNIALVKSKDGRIASSYDVDGVNLTDIEWKLQVDAIKMLSSIDGSLKPLLRKVIDFNGQLIQSLDIINQLNKEYSLCNEDRLDAIEDAYRNERDSLRQTYIDIQKENLSINIPIPDLVKNGCLKRRLISPRRLAPQPPAPAASIIEVISSPTVELPAPTSPPPALIAEPSAPIEAPPPSRTKSTPAAERPWIRAGMRVKIGPNWAWGDQNGGPDEIGVVMEGIDSDGWVRVKWPNGRDQEYRWGNDNKYDLQLVDLELLPQLVSLKKGWRVMRGIDWDTDANGHSNQDGGPGHVGVVLEDTPLGSWVRVRWLDNNYENQYRWGIDGKYDITIRH